MSAKTRVTIGILLLFIPIVLGVAHRMYYYGKSSFVFFWKKPKCNAKDDTCGKKYQFFSEKSEQDTTEYETYYSNLDPENAPPLFIGGNEVMYRYIKRALKYPENETREGTVIVRMRIDEKGRPFDLAVTKSMGKAFDKEAIRALKNMPEWRAQTKNNKPVKSDFIFIEIPFQKPKYPY